jgi:DNA polymerase III epsilon subunit-like protein
MKLKTPPPTEEQQKLRKEQAVKWAQQRLADPDTLIVDVETTGMLHKDPDTEIVQISVINTQGRVVFASLVNPNRLIPIDAQNVHGIDQRMVRHAPTFDQCIGDLIAGVFHGKTVIAFNANFDIHIIVHLMQKYGIPMPEFEVGCVMEEYAAFVGEWSKSKQDYKWQKLPKLAFGKAHDSFVDCQSTLLLLKRMVGDFSDTPDSNEIELDF